MVTPAQAAAARNEPIVVTDSRPARNLAPDFVNYVISQLLELDGIDYNTIYAGGIHVYTTLDLDMQQAAAPRCSAPSATPTEFWPERRKWMPTDWSSRK